MHGSNIDILGLLAEQGFNPRVVGKLDSGDEKIAIDHCPFDSSHTNQDAVFFRDPATKRWGFHCMHDGCRERMEEFKRTGFRRDLAILKQIGGDRSKFIIRDSVEYQDNGQAIVVPKYLPEPIDFIEMLQQDYTLEYLVDGMVVKGQPLLVGGESKTLKTSLMLDLAVSLASGARFLGEFNVAKPMPVWVCSGELGDYTICETYKRIIEAKGLDGQAFGSRLLTSFDLPQLSIDEHLRAIHDRIKLEGVECFIVDPIYLTMLGAGSSDKASNMFAMGPLLARLGKLGKETNCNIIMLHHFKKQQGGKVFEPPTLESFSFAGFAQFARQWFLMARMNRYVPGSGQHNLYLGAGGSSGHGGEYIVTVDEGAMEPGSQRHWLVNVSEYNDDKVHKDSSLPTVEDTKEKILQALYLGQDRELDRKYLQDVCEMNSGTPKSIFDSALAQLIQVNQVMKVPKGEGVAEHFKSNPRMF